MTLSLDLVLSRICLHWTIWKHPTWSSVSRTEKVQTLSLELGDGISYYLTGCGRTTRITRTSTWCTEKDLADTETSRADQLELLSRGHSLSLRVRTNFKDLFHDVYSFNMPTIRADADKNDQLWGLCPWKQLAYLKEEGEHLHYLILWDCVG